MQWRSIISFSISLTRTIGWFNGIRITFYLWTDYLHHLRLLQLSQNIALSRMRSHHSSDCQNRTRTFSDDATFKKGIWNHKTTLQQTKRKRVLSQKIKRDFHSSDQHESSIQLKAIPHKVLITYKGTAPLYAPRPYLSSRKDVRFCAAGWTLEFQAKKDDSVWSNTLCGTE